MTICITNHFETNLVAATYIALLANDRPLIHPENSPSPSKFILPPPSDGGTYEFEDKERGSYLVLFSKLPCLPQDLAKACSLSSTWSSSAESSLTRTVIVVFSDMNTPSAVWIFQSGALVALLPFGIKASLILSRTSRLNLDFDSGILKEFLRQYIAHQIRSKAIFKMEENSEHEVLMAAIIRSLSVPALLYGKVIHPKNLKLLKKFKFLTHDLPNSKVTHLRDLYMRLLPILNTMDVSDLIPPRYTHQIAQWKTEGVIH